MNHRFSGYLVLALSVLGSSSSLGESLKLVSSRIKGLPLHVMSIGINDLKGKDVIDLGPVFKKLHVSIPADGSIVYDTRSGLLMRNLTQASHRDLEAILDDIYGLDKSIAIAGAYLGLLKPLSDKDRFEAVMSAGFPLDPVIESLIYRIRLSRLAEEADPFYPDHKPFHWLLSAKAKTDSETALSELLSEKMNEMEHQLKIANPVFDTMEHSTTSLPPGRSPSGKDGSGGIQSHDDRSGLPVSGTREPEAPIPNTPRTSPPAATPALEPSMEETVQPDAMPRLPHH